MAVLKTIPPLIEKAIEAGADEAEVDSLILGDMATNAASSAGMVGAAFAKPIFAGTARAPSFSNVSDAIELLSQAVNGGDLSGLEEMLVAQAVALQSMFTTFALRAANGGDQTALLTNLALRAQAQSRATIDSITNLKFPRTTVIAKQANVAAAGGMQQVNNGVPASPAPAHEGIAPNKLIAHEEADGRTILDAGATHVAGGTHSAAPALEKVHRTAKRGGQSRGRA